MCGILAVFSDADKKYSEKFLSALNLMMHRGPDDWGVRSGQGYMLGHRRLSIVDLSHDASQPMSSEDGKVSIVFNGEVYNFRELRSELIQAGYRFRTDSDTEVILKAYMHEGKHCVQKFIGMFSIVIVDEREQIPKTVVFRDRLGIKPLYLYSGDDKHIFASEIKSILHLVPHSFELNEAAISSYLSFRYPIQGDTFFRGINVIPPATMISLRGNRIEAIDRYWDLSNFVLGKGHYLSESDCLEEIDKIFSSSIRYRMIADVPVGAYLSGGVDSSLVVAKMASLAGRNVKTFTIGFEEEGYNEFEYSRIVADQYETTHKEIVIDSSQYFAEMEHLIGIKDAPLSVPNEVPLFLMSKELKKDITVVLSGEGADEIFGGYGRIFRSVDDYSRFSKGGLSEEFATAFRQKYGQLNPATELDHFYWNYCYIKPETKSAFLRDDERWQCIETELKHVFEARFGEVRHATYFEKMAYAFETVHLPGLLSRVDTTTMAASVEARVPFVDHRLVELSFRIPKDLKLRWRSDSDMKLAENRISDEVSEVRDIPKYILKKYGERYLTNEILYRKKMGFPVPLDNWFGGEFADLAISIINDQSNAAYEYFDNDRLNGFIRNEIRSHADALKIWMVMNVFVFCSVYKSFLK
jgi:asparagine synthase (glutamine-hydrolysing)